MEILLIRYCIWVACRCYDEDSRPGFLSSCSPCIALVYRTTEKVTAIVPLWSLQYCGLVAVVIAAAAVANVDTKLYLWRSEKWRRQLNWTPPLLLLSMMLLLLPMPMPMPITGWWRSFTILACTRSARNTVQWILLLLLLSSNADDVDDDEYRGFIV